MKKYSVIYADPPWKLSSMSNVAWKKDSVLESKYPTITTEEIKKLPVEKISNDNCSLFLWCTHSTIPDALEVVNSWGFKYHCLITWDKGSGFSLWGFHRRTEFLIYAYKGKINVNQKGKYISTIMANNLKPSKSTELKSSPPEDWDSFDKFAENCVVGTTVDPEGEEYNQYLSENTELCNEIKKLLISHEQKRKARLKERLSTFCFHIKDTDQYLKLKPDEIDKLLEE